MFQVFSHQFIFAQYQLRPVVISSVYQFERNHSPRAGYFTINKGADRGVDFNQIETTYDPIIYQIDT